MDTELASLLSRGVDAGGMIVVLTGAGISAESGIPTFRGEDGYWTVGSTVYHPQQLATHAAFQRMPRHVWEWYLYRRTVCRRARPNPAHTALVALEGSLGDRFRLITQNVDGLHLRAGSSMERTYQVHGNIDYMRCTHECTTALTPIPEAIGEADRNTGRNTGRDTGRDTAGEAARALPDEAFALLRCPACGGPARPHVLWFDEVYDEPRFRFDSSLSAARRASLLIVVGTSASTNLPWHVVTLCAENGAVVIDVNVADNPFGEIADSIEAGRSVRESAARIVPAVVDHLIASQ